MNSGDNAVKGFIGSTHMLYGQNFHRLHAGALRRVPSGMEAFPAINLAYMPITGKHLRVSVYGSAPTAYLNLKELKNAW